MEIERRKVDELKAAEYNPRKDLRPGDAEYEKLKRSIQEFGYVEPVIWNKRTGTVVGGHQRLKVMKDLGYEEVDCVVVDLDEKKEKALNIALNKISGEWDNDLLANLLKDLDGSGYDITLTGFDLAEAQELFGSGSMENVHEDDFDADSNTVGGWTIESIGSFPNEGDSFTYRNMTIKVLKMDGMRVEKVMVKIDPKAEEE